MRLGCLLSLVLCCGAAASRTGTGAHAMKKDMDEDNTDVQFLEPADDGPSMDDQSGSSSGGGGDGASTDAMLVQMRLKAAQDRAKMMKQFMNNFARNMRRSVLQDSEGDMPEDQRLKMLQEVGGQPQVAEEDQDPSEAYIRERRANHHRHMLNGGGGHHSHHGHHRMMLNARRVQSRDADASESRDTATESRNADEDTAAATQAELQNLGGGRSSSAESDSDSDDVPHDRHGHEIVADELGRKMPLLFGGPAQPVAAPKSKAQGSLVPATAALVMLLALGTASF